MREIDVVLGRQRGEILKADDKNYVQNMKN